MLWAIDIGNTRTSAGLLMDGKVTHRGESVTLPLLTNTGALRWARGLRKAGGAEGFAVSSVVPKADGPVAQALRQVFGAQALFVDPSMDLGIRLRVRRPAEVGADRIVNALAARTVFGSPCIVADFGTATTFDVVDRHGDYLGGSILPGIRTAFRALHSFTAKLPDVEFRRASAAIGRSTEEAMRSGVWFGAVGQVRELLLRIRKEMGVVAPAVATGGFCRAFGETGIFHRIEPDLTLMGLALVWKRTHE
jgi:type III pantothenate kinase